MANTSSMKLPARPAVNALRGSAIRSLARAPSKAVQHSRCKLSVSAVANPPTLQPAQSHEAEKEEERHWVSVQLKKKTIDYMRKERDANIRKTKVVCTIGPSSWDRDSLFALADAGMNVCRLNMSHGDHVSHKRVIDLVKEYNKTHANTQVGILLDTKGPEVRSGDLKSPFELAAGDDFLFTIDETRQLGPNETTVNYDNFVKDVKKDDVILVDGGMQSMQIVEVTDTDVKCVVLDGGTFKSRRHLNVRGTTADLPSITEKDWEDLKFGAENEVDFYALSFVHNADAVLQVKQFLRDQGDTSALVLPKIESVNAVMNLDEILAASDGAMVARGDLGAELPEVEVPLIQSEIVAKCAAQGKPVIVATNMLESMIENPCPTRAEVADITVAVREGADCVMLSGETANGAYPVKAVQTMATVAKRVPWELTQSPVTSWVANSRLNKSSLDVNSTLLTEMFAYNAVTMANLQNVPILLYTKSGYSARLISHFRPKNALFAFTTDLKVARRMSIFRGVTAVPVKLNKDMDLPAIHSECMNHLISQGRIKEGMVVCVVNADQDYLNTETEGSLTIQFRTASLK